MEPPASAVQRTAWLYTRGDASVSMTVDDHSTPDVMVLVVCGPGAAIATYNFADQSTLMHFAEQQEQRLRDEGFHLQAIAERRARGDRRQAPRADGVERRRQRL